MMISIAASRALRAAVERQREQQTNSQQLRLSTASISNHPSTTGSQPRQGSSR